MITDKDGRPILHPEDFLACPFCGDGNFMVVPLSGIVLAGGKCGIVPKDESVVYCHRTFKLIPPEFFKTGKLPAEPAPEGKEKPECGPGQSSPPSSPSSSASSS